MSTQPWDKPSYQKFKVVIPFKGSMQVVFADNSKHTVPYKELVGERDDLNWASLTYDEYSMRVSTVNGGYVEIPWMVVRYATDTKFRAYWDREKRLTHGAIGDEIQ